jgi:hypothetical protein
LCSPLYGEPRPLGDAELGGIAAGLPDTYLVMPVILVDNQNTAVTNAAGSRNVSSTAVSNVTVNNAIKLAPTDRIGQLPAVTVNAPVNGSVGGPVVAMPVPGGAASAPPVWVPWAAELRPSLGVR